MFTRFSFCCALSLIVSLAGTAAFGLHFEDSGRSTQNWEILDYKGDSEVYTVTDSSCPPGYGPTVLHVEGDVTAVLAQGSRLREGTFTVLYKENSPSARDADGVIMVWADYGENISAEHNTKIKRAHVWLEQDNDLGIQFRAIDPKGKEDAVVERVGHGIVTDTWNQTNWIWQKVRIDGNRLRAKFWAAEQAEPETWSLDTTYDAPGDRFGLRINSGSIRVAYFAADTKDIVIPAPAAYLHSPLERITSSRRIPFNLFTNTGTNTGANAAKARSIQAEFVVSNADGPIAKKSVALDIPAGHGSFPLQMTTESPEKGFAGTTVSLPEELAAGAYRLTVSDSSGPLAERLFEVASTVDIQRKFKSAQTALNQLSAALKGLDADAKQLAELQVVDQAARAHLQHARFLLKDGRTEESERTFRFVLEALSELHGYKGAWLAAKGVKLDLAFVPKVFDDPQGIATTTERPPMDFCSTVYRLKFDTVEGPAQSLVMGREYEFVIPWRIEGETPDRDFSFEVLLKSPIGNRIVARSKTGPDTPTSQWKPGSAYPQRIRLKLPAEDGAKRPSAPVILDEEHVLSVTVTDPESGARVLLGNAPGHENNRVGTSFELGRFYISSTPLEIRGFTPKTSVVLQPLTERASIRNCGNDELNVDAVLTVSAASGRVLFQDVQPLRLAGGAETDIEYKRTPKTAGRLTFLLELVRGGVTVTRAASERDCKLPESSSIQIAKRNHTEKDGKTFYTPLAVQTHGIESPVTARVYAEGRLAGEETGRSPRFTVKAEPWFGYYDVRVDCGDFVYEERLSATVAETGGGDLLVNGEPFIVKGVNVHGLDASSPERTALIMRLLRELGFNAWRGDYPARWMMDLAYENNSVYTVLAPFSCAHTPDIFARQIGPPLVTARELTRLFVERYRDSAGVLLWNSCNEIIVENIDFLLSLYPVYAAHDPDQRPVHYANLYGQDLWQGQDAMGINYYFAEGQTPEDRQPLVERSTAIGKDHDQPVLFCEFNSYMGSIHSTGAAAMEGLFAWGVEKAGMAGGFMYKLANDSDHPGIVDPGLNRHKIFDDAIREAFADAEVGLVDIPGESVQKSVQLRIRNKRRCTLRQVTVTARVSGVAVSPHSMDAIGPKASVDIAVPIPSDAPGPDYAVEGELRFVTHYGFESTIPFRLVAER